MSASSTCASNRIPASTAASASTRTLAPCANAATSTTTARFAKKVSTISTSVLIDLLFGAATIKVATLTFRFYSGEQ